MNKIKFIEAENYQACETDVDNFLNDAKVKKSRVTVVDHTQDSVLVLIEYWVAA